MRNPPEKVFRRYSLSIAGQAVELKRIMDSELNEKFEKAGYGKVLKNTSNLTGEEYLVYWMRTITELTTIVQ